MKRHTAVLVLVPVLVLAGCAGGLTSEPSPSDSTEVSPEQVPGVTNGTLSNATSLAEANQDLVERQGAVLEINRSSDRFDVQGRVVVAANASTVKISATTSMPDQGSQSFDQWANETTRLSRTASGDQTNYRVTERQHDRLNVLSRTEQFLSAGAFEVNNESTGNGTIVLTAEHPSTDSDAMSEFESFDARLVVTESGKIQQMSVTATQDGETLTYNYHLREDGVETVSKPDWTADVPPGATVQADLSFDVEDDSYLVLEHTRGDTVPSETAVTIESNGTTDTVNLESSLSAGETRYLYFSESAGTLQLTAEQPDPNSVSPVTSPVSVRVVTDGGAVLQSGSFAWASENASAGDGGSAGDSAQSDDGSGTTGSSQSGGNGN